MGSKSNNAPAPSKSTRSISTRPKPARPAKKGSSSPGKPQGRKSLSSAGNSATRKSTPAQPGKPPQGGGRGGGRGGGPDHRARGHSRAKGRRSFSGRVLAAESSGPLGNLLESALHTPESDGYTLTHAFHPYPGRFHRALPAALLEALLPEASGVHNTAAQNPAAQKLTRGKRASTRPESFAASISAAGMRVLDPFMGGGTTLVEAQLRGLPAFGNDLNPVASLVTSERTRPRTREQARRVDTEARRLAGRVEALRGEKKPPQFPMRHQHSLAAHYPRHLLAECMQWIGLISALPADDIRETLRAVFSSAVVKFSNLPSDSQAASSSRARTGKRTGGAGGGDPAPPGSPKGPHYPKGAVSRFLVDKCGELTRAQVELGTRIPRGTPPVRLYSEDARLLPSLGWGEFDVILTSPPYPGTYDYHAHHKLRMDWLELDGEALLEGEIGARRMAQAHGIAPSRAAGGQPLAGGAQSPGSPLSHGTRQAKGTTGKGSGDRPGDGWNSWSADFRDVLGTLARVCKPGGSLFLVMGDWISAGHGVDAAGMVTRLARGKGWRLESRASVQREVFTPLEKKAYAKKGKWEHLLQFQRGTS